MKYTKLTKTDSEEIEKMIMKEYDKENKPYITIISGAQTVYVMNPAGNGGKGTRINLTTRFIRLYAKVAKIPEIPEEVIPSLRQVLILLLTQSDWDYSIDTNEDSAISEEIDLTDSNDTQNEKILKEVRRRVEERRQALMHRRDKIPPFEKIHPHPEPKVDMAIVDEAKLVSESEIYKKSIHEKKKKRPRPLPLA